MNTPAPTQVEPLTDEQRTYEASCLNALRKYVDDCYGNPAHIRHINQALATITQLQGEIARLKESSQADTGTSEGPLDGERSQDYYDSLHADAMATKEVRADIGVLLNIVREQVMSTDYPVSTWENDFVTAILAAGFRRRPKLDRQQLIDILWGKEIEVAAYISTPQEKASINHYGAECIADAIIAHLEKQG